MSLYHYIELNMQCASACYAAAQLMSLRLQADHGEESYKGSGKLVGKKAVITGGDSGIGRAVAIAFAREGSDVLISYLEDSEDEDAHITAGFVEAAGRKAILINGHIQDEMHCKHINTTSVNAYCLNYQLLPYAATKEAIQNFTVNLSQILLMNDKEIRVKGVAPGPIWTPRRIWEKYTYAKSRSTSVCFSDV